MRPFDVFMGLSSSLGTAIRHSQPTIPLDLLRSELSHETAAKIARLSALVAQWRLGRYEPTDPADADAILADLESIPLRHARRAVARFSTLASLVCLVGATRTMRSILRPLSRRRALSGRELDKLAAEIEVVRLRTRSHVRNLTRPHAESVGVIVLNATDEIRREIGGGLEPGSVGIELVGTESAGNTWVPRADADRWRDVLRNLVRNAVQATGDLPASPGGHAEAVCVRVSAGRPSGSVIEIEDHGIGMDQATSEGIWRAGTSRRGLNRGQGLTEVKRTFVLSRASLELRTAPGVGTVFRIEIPARDIVLPAVRAAHLRPAYLVAILFLATVAMAFHPRPSIVSVERVPPNTVRAVDARGKVRWTRNMNEEVMGNYTFTHWSQAGQRLSENDQLLVHDHSGVLIGTVVATQPPQGSGRVWFISADGKRERVQPVGWISPSSDVLGKLMCWWRTTAPWNDGQPDVVVLHIRDSRYSPSATEFFRFDGDSLGAYYHPGHLQPHSASDIDGDGHMEMLLLGINNPAQYDTSFVSPNPSTYCDCVVLLEPPNVSGQAWPYRAWEGMPRANEEGYLILPPLQVGLRPEIMRIDIGAEASGRARIEIVTMDGRIYHTDPHLRPISCGVGDLTRARALAPVYPMAPLLWIHDGVQERVDIEVGGDGRARPTAERIHDAPLTR